MQRLVGGGRGRKGKLAQEHWRNKPHSLVLLLEFFHAACSWSSHCPILPTPQHRTTFKPYMDGQGYVPSH